MSKISNELRRVSDNYVMTENLYGVLRDLANRIDHEMVELPKDKDGNPINLGYTVYNFESGSEWCVNKMWYVKRVNHEPLWEVSSDYGLASNPADLTITKPDSLKRIADEIGEVGIVSDYDLVKIAKTQLREWADRIRKLAEEHKHEND